MTHGRWRECIARLHWCAVGKCRHAFGPTENEKAEAEDEVKFAFQHYLERDDSSQHQAKCIFGASVSEPPLADSKAALSQDII